MDRETLNIGLMVAKKKGWNFSKFLFHVVLSAYTCVYYLLHVCNSHRRWKKEHQDP